MTFLNPLVLFGLAAAALPVILHLLNRRRLRIVEFSTLRFLKEIQNSSLRRVKLRQWLLLLLRTCLIISLVLAFARPVLRADLAGSAGPRAATAIVLLIDDSPSMGVRTPRGALLAQARDAAARILSTAAVSDRAAVIPLSSTYADTVRPEFQQAEGARARLGDVAQSEVSVPVATGLRAATRLCATAQEANREIYLITDGQATQFRTHTGDSLPPPPDGVRLSIVRTPGGTTANIGIVRIQSLTRVRSVGRPAVLSVTIRNYGDSPIPSLPVSIHLDGVHVAQQSATFAPRSTSTLTVPVVPRRSGILTGVVRIEEDALELDNERSFILTVPAESRITLAGPSEPGIRFARIALTLGGDSLAAGRIRLREIADSQLPTADFGSTDILFLAGIDLLTPAQGFAVTSFVRRGGSAILFPGPDLHPESYRRNLWGPLSLPGWNPAEVTREGGAGSLPGQVASFARIDYDHPLFAGLFADDRLTRNEGVESPAIMRTAGLGAGPQGRAIITLTNGEPFLVEYRGGAGTLLVFNVESGTIWSDFPLKGIFAPLLHRAAAYLTSFTEDDSAVAAGSPVRFPLRQGTLPAGAHLLLRTPGGVEERVIQAEGPVEGESGGIAARTMVTGAYRLYSVRPGDSTLVGARVAVMPEPEGDLRGLEEGELGSIAPVLMAGEGLEDQVREQRVGTELWLLFLALAGLLASAEMWVAREGKEVGDLQ